MKLNFISISTIIGLSCQIAAAEVTWRTGERLPAAMPREAIRAKAADWKARHVQGGPRERHILVQLDERLSSARRSGLANKGVRLLQPLGGNAFFATIDNSRFDSVDLAQNHHIAGMHDILRS